MSLNERSAIIIQARMSSHRFPGKMMSPLFNMPLIEYVYKRCQKSCVSKVLVATSDDTSDDNLYNYCQKNKISIIRGKLNNVLQRYIQAGESLGVDYIVRVCGDTPFVDIFLIDKLLEVLIRAKLDYVSFDRERCSPGFYSETVTLKALRKVAKLTNAEEDLEHVTKFIVEQKDQFLTRFIGVDLNPQFIGRISLTIDSPEHLQRANKIVNALPDKFRFGSQDVLNIIRKGQR